MLKGELPSDLPVKMPSLAKVSIVDTALSGPIPDTWFSPGSWLSMDGIAIENNTLLTGDGHIPFFIE